MDQTDQPDLPPLPDWVTPGAVFSYRGGTYKILRIGPRLTETVGHDHFSTWHTPQFREQILAGEITHSPNGRRVRPPAAPRPFRPSRQDEAAADCFWQRYTLFSNDGQPHIAMMRWTNAIGSGTPVQPWQHLLALYLIRLGAEQIGLGPDVANPRRRGRPSSKRDEAASTQSLIAEFERFLEGGDPPSQADWGWLKQLLEDGMMAVGIMPPRPAPSPGRPADRQSPHRSIVAQQKAHQRNSGRGSLARLTREAALEVVLRQRQVQAAWNGEDFAAVTVSPDDPDLASMAITIAKNLRTTRQRKAIAKADPPPS